MNVEHPNIYCALGILQVCLCAYATVSDCYVALSDRAMLTHWGRVTHICVSKLTITGSDNGLSPGRRQATIWTNAGILLIGPSGTNFSENLIEILSFSFTKMRLKVSSAKWWPFCLGLNVLSMTVLADESMCTYYIDLMDNDEALWELPEMSLWCHQMEEFPHCWSFVRGIHRSPVDSPHQG